MADEREKPRAHLRVVPGGKRPGVSDEALLAAFLVGDDEAFGELVVRHERLVLAIVRRYARTPDDARDLVQRTFLRALEAARRTLRRGRQAKVPFRGWLVRIAVNLGKNALRDARRAGRVIVAADPGASSNADVQDHAAARPGDALLDAERRERMRAAVLELPRRQREVLTLRVDAELPFAEIALALGITENAAKVTFHHATQRLRARLAEDPS